MTEKNTTLDVQTSIDGIMTQEVPTSTEEELKNCEAAASAIERNIIGLINGAIRQQNVNSGIGF